MQNIDTNECFLFAWKIFKKRPWFFIGFTAFVFIVSIVTTITRAQLSNAGSDLVDGAGLIIALVISVYIAFVQTKLYLKAHDSIETLSTRDSWSTKGLWKFALLYITLGIAILIGFILLVIPGILLSLISIFAIYTYVDQDLGPIESFKKSFELTKDHLWEVFVFLLELICINLLGAICLLVGLLVSVPLSILATVHLYRLIQSTASPKMSVEISNPEVA